LNIVPLHFTAPGLQFGVRPEASVPTFESDRPGAADRALVALRARWNTRLRVRRALVREVQVARRSARSSNAVEGRAQAASPAAHPAEIRHRLTRSNDRSGARIAALAHAAVVAERTLGLVPRPCQLEAAWWMLDGRFVELATGEGKTLSTALAAAVTALAGTPVHVVTANDYLAERDAASLGVFYAALGLCSAAVVSGLDDARRRAAYRLDIVHVTGKQLAFDDLRDGLQGSVGAGPLEARLAVLAHRAAPVSATTEAMLPGLCAAFVDEADAVLIDEARLPLVMADRRDDDPDEDAASALALALARSLREGRDYVRQGAMRRPTLTDEGRALLASRTRRLPDAWRTTRYRDEFVRQALVALHSLRRDRDYIVSDGSIELVDAATGRPAPDRTLQHGLHRLVELKERCRTTQSTEVRAATSFQRFFTRYHRLAGTSGTLAEVRSELLCFYGASTVAVAGHRPCLRQGLGTRVLTDRAEQLAVLLERVLTMQAVGRPTLLGTASVEQSAAVALYLESSGIACRTLDASQTRDEAEIVATAGQAAQVTVATRMAGRGTDIVLADGVEGCGGLHVIILSIAESRRFDRQLAGRAARGGDRGSTERLLCLDDDCLSSELPERLRRLLGTGLQGRGAIRRSAHVVALACVALARARVERRHAGERLRLFLHQPHAERRLAFAGPADAPSP